ncbi:hypothetical protein FRC01_007347 [Tulasnella sp. 417]|nr:hypothetical protein FRC01_007347 [Tulasnella sp. 417]
MFLSPSWRRISIIAASVVIRLDPDDGRALVPVPLDLDDRRAVSRLFKAYTGDPQTVLENLELILNKSGDTSHTDRHTLVDFNARGEATVDGDGQPSNGVDSAKSHIDRHILIEILGSIFDATGKAAVDDDGQPSSGVDAAMIAKLIRLSEVIFRDNDSPSSYLDVGRALRRRLTGGLLSALRNGDDPQNNVDLERTINELFDLFSYLTESDGKPTLSLYWDNLEITSLVLPALQRLDETLRENRFMMARFIEPQMKQLQAKFALFESTVSELSRHIMMRQRDPELQWCHV